MDSLSEQTVAREGKSLFRSLSLLLEDEGQCNRVGQKQYSKFVLCLPSQTIHPATTIAG
jgi:hypothetical protein